MDCGLQEWWRLTLLVLFPLGPPSALGRGWGGQAVGVGRRLPVNIWTRVGSGAGVGRSQGSQAGEVGAPPNTGRGRLSMGSPPPSQNKTMVKTRMEARSGYGHSLHLGQGQASNREACGSPSPKSLELRVGLRGAKNREERRGKAARGQAGSVVLLPPSSSGAGVAESAVALEVGDSQGVGREGGSQCGSLCPPP